MRNISFRIDDADFEALTAVLPCKPGSYFKTMAYGILNGKEKPKTIEVDYRDEFLDNVVQTCLTTSQKSALEAAAKRHGWNLSRELRFRIQRTLSGKLDFFDHELRVLNGARNAVDVVGRNLHYIIIRDNAQVIDKSGFKSDVARLENSVADLKKELESYIRLCRGRRIYGDTTCEFFKSP